MTGAGRQVNRAGRPLLPVKMQVAGLVRNSMPMVTGFVGAPLWELRPSRSGVTDGSRLRLVSSRSRYARPEGEGVQAHLGMEGPGVVGGVGVVDLQRDVGDPLIRFDETPRRFRETYLGDNLGIDQALVG